MRDGRKEEERKGRIAEARDGREEGKWKTVQKRQGVEESKERGVNYR
jgi:hypothetical protein